MDTNTLVEYSADERAAAAEPAVSSAVPPAEATPSAEPISLAAESQPASPPAGSGARVAAPPQPAMPGPVAPPWEPMSPAGAGGAPPYMPPAPPYGPHGPYAPPPLPRRSGVPWYAWVIGGVVGVLLVGALACAALGAAIGGIVGTIAKGPQETTIVTRTFDVAGTPNIVTHNLTGTTTIVADPDGKVTAQVTKKARDADSQTATRDLQDITVTFNQSGSMVTVDVQYSGGMGLRRQLSADLLITVPATARIDATVTTGTLDMRDVTLSDASRLDVTTGELTFDGALAAGASLDASVTTGNLTLTLPTDTPAHLSASTVTGNLVVSGWSIPVTGTFTSHQASGDLNPNPTATLTARVTTGNLTIAAR